MPLSLLIESGAPLLTEEGQPILLEQSGTVLPLLTESGVPLLTEEGPSLLLEQSAAPDPVPDPDPDPDPDPVPDPDPDPDPDPEPDPDPDPDPDPVPPTLNVTLGASTFSGYSTGPQQPIYHRLTRISWNEPTADGVWFQYREGGQRQQNFPANLLADEYWGAWRLFHAAWETTGTLEFPIEDLCSPFQQNGLASRVQVRIGARGTDGVMRWSAPALVSQDTHPALSCEALTVSEVKTLTVQGKIRLQHIALTFTPTLLGANALQELLGSIDGGPARRIKIFSIRAGSVMIDAYGTGADPQFRSLYPADGQPHSLHLLTRPWHFPGHEFRKDFQAQATRITGPIDLPAREGAMVNTETTPPVENMLWADYLADLADTTDQNPALVNMIVTAGFLRIREIVAQGGSVDLRWFGRFYAARDKEDRRIPKFALNQAFRLGTQQGVVMP